MWAKRFPVPEFDRHCLKNLDWTAPDTKDSLDETNLGGLTALSAPESLFQHFGYQGDHLLAVGIKLPDQPVRISGNSFAWPIQRVVITDSLDVTGLNVLADWKTPRPMNTRLGPDEGIEITASEAYVLIGHQFADHWIASRVMLDNEWSGESGQGCRILSSCETQINDFHDAVVYFEW